MPRVSSASAAALTACCFVLVFSSITAEHIEFDVWHRLGSDSTSKWKPAGSLSGEVDTGALIDAAEAALRGGGGRVAPPAKASSPVLTLFRDEQNAISVDEAQRAAERGQGYSIKLKRKLDRSQKKKTTKTKNDVALFTSAPPHCAAAALSGALPLKLDGSLPRSTSFSSGGSGIRVTGVSFDFYGGACSSSNKGGSSSSRQGTAKQQRVPLWLPAAAPPLLPPPPPPAAAKKAAAAAALAQAQAAEAARRRAANGGEADDDASAPPPVEDTRTWLQKNWVYALPMLMMAMNVMNAAAGPPPQQQRRPGAGAAGAAAAGAVAAGAAAVAGGAGPGGGGGVASLD